MSPGRYEPGRKFRTIDNTLLLDEGLPPGLRASWGDRIPIITRDEWQAMDPLRSAHLIGIEEVRMSGPILKFSYSTSNRMDQAPRLGPHTYSTGTTLYLARWEGEWWILMPGGGWIS